MNRLDPKPGNMFVELVGGPHDGKALEVPLWVESVWLHMSDDRIMSIGGEPVAGLAFTLQVKYVAQGRCSNAECKYQDRVRMVRVLLDHEERQPK